MTDGDQFAPRSEPDGRYERKCAHCGKPFRTNNSRALYHTEKCKATAAFARHYARNREKIIEHVKDVRKAKKSGR